MNTKDNLAKDQSGIYVIVNLQDNKKYLGSSINFRKRKYDHFNSLKKGKHENRYLQRSFDKYGIDNFEFRVVEYCERDNCLLLEQQYLDKIFSFNETMEQYYNINPFAIKPPTMCGKDNPNYGKDFSAETRLKMSLAKRDIMNGENNHFFGKKHPEETRLKMKVAHNVPPVHIKSMITQEELTFPNVKETAKFLNIGNTAICDRLDQKSKRYTNSLIKNEWKVSR